MKRLSSVNPLGCTSFQALRHLTDKCPLPWRWSSCFSCTLVFLHTAFPKVHAHFSSCSCTALCCADLQEPKQGRLSQKSAALALHGPFCSYILFLPIVFLPKIPPGAMDGMGSALECALGLCGCSLPCAGVLRLLNCHGNKRIRTKSEKMIKLLLLALVRYAAELCLLDEEVPGWV